MEPDAEPWEALDLDDSDAPSLLRPCKRKPQTFPSPTSTPKRDLQPFSLSLIPDSPLPYSPIPGPAGAVQAAMLRKLQNRNNLLGTEEEPLPTQEYIRKAVEDPGADDDDFSRNPWLFALEFIRREGLADNRGTIGTPLSWIKTEPKIGNRKVAQVVVIIKSCMPNGLGDLMVTLKDPTGAIDASIHRKVLAQRGFGKDISVGTVLILQKVSIFSPSRSARYLNITLGNVVKAFSKDSEPLSQQNTESIIVTPHVHGFENSKEQWIQQKVLPERNETIMNSFRQTGYMRGSVHNSKGSGDKVSGSNCCIDGRNTSHNAIAGKEPTGRLENVSGMKKAAAVAGTDDREENAVLEKQLSHQNLGGVEHHHLESHQSSGGTNLFGAAVIKDQEQDNITTNGDKKQKQLSVSRGSLPKWTDEQLDELCSFE